ncbi:hypothetical protein PF005_g20225 [Phytophthora fragariae]|uniref:Uncharacterized protein n=1 Tax=Phytophthora fragariae TaxID=53985 RepID=A0A6A3WMY7_9STRA|nr:hypothetical protein PF005_g20225 [Phytophthora fragariae]
MAEVANNMKKKGKERQRGEGEQVEEERKRRQMQEEMKAKEQARAPPLFFSSGAPRSTILRAVVGGIPLWCVTSIQSPRSR